MVGESRFSDVEAGEGIRKMFKPTTDPNRAQQNIEAGFVTLLKLQLGAKVKRSRDESSSGGLKRTKVDTSGTDK
ncbi:MAG: hypothetical protein GY754_02770 [bacterium]|nr:hypothetical protein [bacterium]